MEIRSTGEGPVGAGWCVCIILVSELDNVESTPCFDHTLINWMNLPDFTATIARDVTLHILRGYAESAARIQQSDPDHQSGCFMSVR